MNPYKILGIDPSATLDDIKKAYRKLSKEHHPDQGGKEEKFMEINLCYRVLSDPQKRKLYDERGVMMDESPEHVHNIVKSRLAGILEAWLENMVKGQRISMEDFFDKHINSAINEIAKNNGNMRDSIRKFKDIRKHVTCEAENNLLHALIDQKIEMINKGILQNTAEKNIMKALKEAVKDYGFEGETGMQSPTITIDRMVGGTSTSTFSWG